MKSISLILLAGAFVVSSFAQDAKPNTATNKAPQLIVTIPVTAAVVTAPFVVTNGVLSQPEQREVTDGGKAVFDFSLTNSGTYLVRGLANATEETMNSFFVNVDAQPNDTMIWDLDVTNGFEERTANWRGNGAADSGEFVPKKFKLSAGAHKLIIVGREPTQLKSISILREGD
jgi:hypothetical protein